MVRETHYSAVKRKKPFTCDSCGKSYSNLCNLTHHMENYQKQNCKSWGYNVKPKGKK